MLEKLPIVKYKIIAKIITNIINVNIKTSSGREVSLKKGPKAVEYSICLPLTVGKFQFGKFTN